MSAVHESRIRQRRLALGLSQAMLANAVGTNQAQISKFEHGESTPSGEILAALSRELEVTTDWLLGLSESQNGNLQGCDLSTKEQRIVTALRQGKPLKAIKTIVLNDGDSDDTANDDAA